MKSRSARKIHRSFDRCGVNVGVSNVLMAGAVISLGFAVFYWIQRRSLDANKEYAGLVPAFHFWPFNVLKDDTKTKEEK